MKRFTLLSTRAGALFMTPAALLVGAFVIVPFFWVIFVSFTNRSLLGRTALNPEFVGLQNYLALFNPDGFLTRGQFGFSLILTVQFVILSALVGQALLGMLLAWLIRSVPKGVKTFIESAVIAAWILPEVVIGFAWFAFLDYDNGTLNMMLNAVGLPSGDWLLQHPFWVIVVFNTWRGAAFSMMLFNSAFASIPPSYFQAAEVAGASSWQKFRDIALPLIRGHVVTDLILITMWTFNVFTPFLLTHGGSGLPHRAPVDLHLPRRLPRLRVRQGRGGRRRHHADQPRLRARLPPHRPQAADGGGGDRHVAVPTTRGASGRLRARRRLSSVRLPGARIASAAQVFALPPGISVSSSRSASTLPRSDGWSGPSRRSTPAPTLVPTPSRWRTSPPSSRTPPPCGRSSTA